MKLLFFVYDAPWPIRGGQQLHAYNMIKALTSLGHEVHMTTCGDTSNFPADKHKGWSVSRLVNEPDCTTGKNYDDFFRWMAVRWMQYWGTPGSVLASLGKLVQEFRPNAVILVGLQALPLSAIRYAPVVWYAADDWVLHHLTLAKTGSFRDRLNSIFSAGLSFCYERSLSSLTDGAIAVSRKDQKALKWVGGFKRVSIIPNGVDADYFKPIPDGVAEKFTICFWGRMDFAPNVDAMIWFCDRVWPILRSRFPTAVLTIVGANPTLAVKEHCRYQNVIVTGEVDDIRPFAWHSQVVVMPIRIGAGIKNKLLEACAMGKAIVASKIAVSGLELTKESSETWLIAKNIDDWVNAIELLWTNPKVRQRIGSSARNYVEKNYSWRKAANRLAGFISKIESGF